MVELAQRLHHYQKPSNQGIHEFEPMAKQYMDEVYWPVGSPRKSEAVASYCCFEGQSTMDISTSGKGLAQMVYACRDRD